MTQLEDRKAAIFYLRDRLDSALGVSMRHLWLAAALLLTLTACGGRGAGSVPTNAGGPSDRPPLILAGDKFAQLPELPPAGHFLPQRVASQALVQQTGSQAWKSASSFPQAPALTLNAQPEKVAYAIYRFD